MATEKITKEYLRVLLADVKIDLELKELVLMCREVLTEVYNEALEATKNGSSVDDVKQVLSNHYANEGICKLFLKNTKQIKNEQITDN